MNILKMIGDFNINHADHKRESSTARRISTVLNENTSFLVREAYNAARTNIIYSLGNEKGCKKIIVTSASPHEGKTTTCLNLAITFAQTESKVLIIDADLRKPRIYRHLMLEKENGLSDLLCGLIDIDQAIKHSKYNLDCITSGQIPPNPTELLSSTEMANLLEKLGERYDYIFIDTPPITVVTEAAAMSKYTSGAIFIVRQNSTVHESIKRAISNMKMANTKILGFILNDVNPSSYSYGGGYSKYNYRGNRNYYNYGYGYGYGEKSSKGYGYGYGYGHKKKKTADESADKKQKNAENKKQNNSLSSIMSKISSKSKEKDTKKK